MNLKELMTEVRSNKRSQDMEGGGAKINGEKLWPGVFISWLLRYCTVSFLQQKEAVCEVPQSTRQLQYVMQESLVLCSVLSTSMEDEINYVKITNEVKRNKYGSECKEFMGIPF